MTCDHKEWSPGATHIFELFVPQHLLDLLPLARGIVPRETRVARGVLGQASGDGRRGVGGERDELSVSASHEVR
jgi:hypothetical protein